MYKTLFGKEPAEAVLDDVKKKIAKLGRFPKLVIVQAGDDPASTVYVRNKVKSAESVGVKADVIKLPDSVTETEILDIVEKLNEDKTVDGFIVQVPLPAQINTTKVIDAIRPQKDADGFTSQNMGKLFLGMPAGLLPATPSGIMKMLDFYKIPIEGKHAVVVGRSNIVGKPISLMLLNRNATVTMCHSKTRDLAKHTSTADILIAAVGKPGLISADMVKEGACVIDVGTTKSGDRFVGDVDFMNVIKKAHCSPVPGGVGPMTRALLLYNVVTAAEGAHKNI